VISARHDFANRDTLAEGLADRVSRGLSRAISRKGEAVLAVSGGTTPRLFFDYLSRVDIAWDKVTITLVDERQVDEDSQRSNARLVRENLMQNHAAAARFVPLFRNELSASALEPDVAVLGMGEDGHTASFFPGGSTLGAALDPKNTTALITMAAPGATEPRLTFTLAHLLKAKVLCLHIEGQGKQAVLEKAMAGSDVQAMPIRALLQADRPIEIFWCP
jgi:6-phosphogluconolactonase